MPITFAIPIPTPSPVCHSSAPAKFIESSDGELFNISMAYKCGTYKSEGLWWVWFKIHGSSITYYYMYPHQTEAEAKNKLLQLLETVE